MKPGVWTKFYLNIIYTAVDTVGCRASLNIVDINGEPIYRLSLQVGGESRKVIQKSKLNNEWTSSVVSSMPDLGSVNEIMIVVNPLTYNVKMNEQSIQPQFPTDEERLQDYQNLEIFNSGSCLRFDLDKSNIETQDPQRSTIG